jgi:predicted RNA binding protein YcfA (HicA-like mRNA interferase family)
MRGQERFVVPFHSGKDLYPKIVKQLMLVVERN